MATTRLLLKEICAAVREALADYPFPAPDGSWSDVRVFLHGLPQEQGDACYPFVIVRWISGSMEEETAQVTRLRETVGLALGVYASKTQEQAGILLADMVGQHPQGLAVLRLELAEALVAAGIEKFLFRHQSSPSQRGLCSFSSRVTRTLRSSMPS